MLHFFSQIVLIHDCNFISCELNCALIRLYSINVWKGRMDLSLIPLPIYLILLHLFGLDGVLRVHLWVPLIVILELVWWELLL